MGGETPGPVAKGDRAQPSAVMLGLGVAEVAAHLAHVEIHMGADVPGASRGGSGAPTGSPGGGVRRSESRSARRSAWSSAAAPKLLGRVTGS